MGEIDEVVGIILAGDRFLVERRKTDEKVDPSIVCLPGGHVKAGESLKDALKREMCEELRIEVKESKFICRNFYVVSNGERQNACCFLIAKFEGMPVGKSAQEILWTSRTQDLSLEVDKKTIKKLRKQMHGR